MVVANDVGSGYQYGNPYDDMYNEIKISYIKNRNKVFEWLKDDIGDAGDKWYWVVSVLRLKNIMTPGGLWNG